MTDDTVDVTTAAETAAPDGGMAADVATGFGFTALDEIQARVLGVLIEKQLSTPDYYPLTLKAAVSGCNQKNNREPVFELAEKSVSRALDHLREKKLVWMVHAPGSRTPKYEQHVEERIFLAEPQELSVLAELLVRGPQTPGQLRSHTERMHLFASRDQVQDVLDGLAARGVPLVVRMAHLPGQKEARYAHLLSGPVEDAVLLASGADRAAPPLIATEDSARIADLEQKVSALAERVAALEGEYASFRRQFE